MGFLFRNRNRNDGNKCSKAVVIEKTDTTTGHFVRESHGHVNRTKVGGKMSVGFRVIETPGECKRICSFLRDLSTLFRVENVHSFLRELNTVFRVKNVRNFLRELTTG
jgi:hypothetical protein